MLSVINISLSNSIIMNNRILVASIVLAITGVGVVNYSFIADDDFERNTNIAFLISDAYAESGEGEKSKGDSSTGCTKAEEQPDGTILWVDCGGDANYCEGPGEKCSGVVACHDVCF